MERSLASLLNPGDFFRLSVIHGGLGYIAAHFIRLSSASGGPSDGLSDLVEHATFLAPFLCGAFYQLI
jgi:hypothetical protein